MEYENIYKKKQKTLARNAKMAQVIMQLKIEILY